MRAKKNQGVHGGRNTYSSKQKKRNSESFPFTTPASKPISSKELHGDCLKAFKFIESVSFNLGALTDSIFYGNSLSRAPSKMKVARASFVQTDKFMGESAEGGKRGPRGEGKGTVGKECGSRVDGEEGVDKATLDGYGASIKPHPNFVRALCICSM
jgi:hypothetical protein